MLVQVGANNIEAEKTGDCHDLKFVPFWRQSVYERDGSSLTLVIPYTRCQSVGYRILLSPVSLLYLDLSPNLFYRIISAPHLSTSCFSKKIYATKEYKWYLARILATLSISSTRPRRKQNGETDKKREVMRIFLIAILITIFEPHSYYMIVSRGSLLP